MCRLGPLRSVDKLAAAETISRAAFVRRAVIYAVRASDEPRRAIEATEEGGPTAEDPRRGQSGDSPMAANC
jgi:hypothetical protein